jgi:hypothetical protein
MLRLDVVELCGLMSRPMSRQKDQAPSSGSWQPSSGWRNATINGSGANRKNSCDYNDHNYQLNRSYPGDQETSFPLAKVFYIASGFLFEPFFLDSSVAINPHASHRSLNPVHTHTLLSIASPSTLNPQRTRPRRPAFPVAETLIVTTPINVRWNI